MRDGTEQDVLRKEAEEYGWRVHSALDSWTGKVDTKASIALAIETAVFGFVLSLSDEHRRFSDLHGSNMHWYRAGVACLAVAVLLSLLVVMPQLARRNARKTWRHNMIYFGHLRRWNAEDLATALVYERGSLDQLAAQLVMMSKIAWRKHAWLQWSILWLVAGCSCLFAAT